MAGLILDSSTDTLILALDAPIRWRTFEDAAKIGSSLFSLLEDFIEKKPEYIAVGRGPGSYTGTRAAVAAATGYAQGADIPLFLFPSPLAFLPQGECVAALLEIKGVDECYALFYERGVFRELRAPLQDLLPLLASLDAVASQQPLPQISHTPLQFHPEAGISRIAAWVKPQLISSTPLDSQLVYLHQKM